MNNERGEGGGMRVAEETEMLEENYPQFHCVHHEPHIT
jgi:hypothetical protein